MVLGGVLLGICPALRRLGTQASDPNLYRSIFDLLAGGGRLAKLVHHMQSIDDRTIDALCSLPNDRFSVQVVSRLIERSVSIDKLSATVWIANALKNRIGQQLVIDRLRRSSNPLRTIENLLVELPFPSPPIQFRFLTAVSSIGQLKEIAKRFRNCLTDTDQLSDTVLAVQSGSIYLYAWECDEPALIQLNRFGGIGWVIDQAYGVENRPVGRQTGREIGRELATNPQVCLAWPNRAAMPTDGWFFR